MFRNLMLAIDKRVFMLYICRELKEIRAMTVDNFIALLIVINMVVDSCNYLIYSIICSL